MHEAVRVDRSSQPMTGTEVPLSGGNMSSGVVRVGDTVRRPAGPWTPAVHALLAHLHDVGFRGAPRPLGIDERGREILTFVPGPVAWPGTFYLLDDDGQLRRVACLIREFHDAVDGFTPPPGDFLAQEAAQGTPPWARLWQEGHGDAWHADTRYIAQREHQWHQALLG
jgi:hypothetical protein